LLFDNTTSFSIITGKEAPVTTRSSSSLETLTSTAPFGQGLNLNYRTKISHYRDVM